MRLLVLLAWMFAFPGFLAGQAFAVEANYSHNSTPAETALAKAKNHAFQARAVYSSAAPAWQPSLDTADFGYVLMNADEEGSSEVANLRKTIAQNLPANVKLVILTSDRDANKVRTKYLQWIPANQLIIAADSSRYVNNGFWARDAFPVPVTEAATGKTHLISAEYFRYFESADVLANSVNGLVTKISAVFVGGNLLADEDGHCFSVDSSRLYDMTERDLKSIYGCKEVHLMRHLSGIGDIDEDLKPLPGRRMLVAQPGYKSTLEALGYQVIMLPSISNSYRTYANSLIVGKTAFVPTFGIDKDAEAVRVYQSLGYNVVPIRTNYLADQLQGSIHCQTMAYPKMDQNLLFQTLKIRAL